MSTNTCIAPEFQLPKTLTLTRRIVRTGTFYQVTPGKSIFVIIYHYNRKADQDEIIWRGHLTLDQLSYLNVEMSK